MDVVRAHFIASYFPSAFLLPFFFYLCCECYLCFPLDWCEKYLYNWIRFCFFHYCVTFWEIALQNGKHYSVHHKENGRPSSTWYCIIFSICISTFSSWTYVGNEMRSSRFKQFLSYLRFMFWCLQLHGSFWHWDVSEALGANISLKLTLLFFLPSDSPCQRFGLRAACLETAAAFGRSIQDSEDSHGGEKPRERELERVPLCSWQH